MSTRLKIEPMDLHNRSLLENVHPADWVNPEPARRYNLVVIGAGTAGLVAAAGVAGLGGKVALIERNLLGGDCLNVGCVPSKCLIRSSRAAADIGVARDMGITVSGEAVADFPAVMERLRKLRSQISAHDSARRFRDLGVDVFIGEGRFASADIVEVAGKALRFKKALIATGARAVEPDLPGLAEAGYLTNETVFNLTELPRRIAVFGAGPIGCELAQAFRRLGAEVAIVQRGGQLLKREDPDASQILARAFERDGVRVMLNSTVTHVTRTNENEKTAHIVQGDAETTLVVDAIIVGAGRAPNVEGLNLERVGVKYDSREGVHVNDKLQTTNPRIYAAGDICLKYKFTHTADATARIVLRNALFFGRAKLSALTIPWCTYTDPEIAHVGLYEADAGRQGVLVDTFIRRFDEVERAIVDGETGGFVRIHVKKGTDRILGATIVARHAGEMIGELTLAMVNKVGLGSIANVIHPYPTQAEAIRQLGDAYNRTRLTPFLKKVFASLLAWRR